MQDNEEINYDILHCKMVSYWCDHISASVNNIVCSSMSLCRLDTLKVMQPIIGPEQSQKYQAFAWLSCNPAYIFFFVKHND